MRDRAGHTRRVRNALALVATAAVTTVAIAGCGSSNTTGPGPGSLTVTITAPAGVTPAVTVHGPGAYTKTLTATATLTGLAVGSYTVVAAPVMTANAIAGKVYGGTVSGSPATVASGATPAATVTYALRPGSGALWVGNFGTSNTVTEYTAAQLGSSTSAAPTTSIRTAAQTIGGAAFDASGNLWVTQFASGNTVLEYTANQLSDSGTLTPAVTIGSLSNPAGMAFDASGNLWVANVSVSTVVEFTANQLSSSGSPVPAVTLSAADTSLEAPVALAFDAHGNLWVANVGRNTVVEFKSIQLATTGSPTPAVTLRDTASSISGPLGIAFDASGNLWVANGNSHADTVVAFTPSQLGRSGRPKPAIVLTSSAFSNPAGLAFDASGDLWVANNFPNMANTAGNTVTEFTPAQLAHSGSPTPVTTISGPGIDLPFALAFNTHAPNLPLKP